MSVDELKTALLELARAYIAKGPGYSQEGVVLRAAVERGLSTHELQSQQVVLTCWNDLFREGKLSWGYNLDNPDRPFLHESVRQLEKSNGAST